MTKECTKCKRLVRLSCFYKDKRTKDGLYSACRDCHTAMNVRKRKELSRAKKAIKEKMTEKQCTKCKETKNLKDEFIWIRKKKVYTSQCRECTNRRVRLTCRRTYNAAKQHENYIRYKKSGRYEISRKRSVKKLLKRHNARSALRYAVRVGKIIKKPCEKCGDEKVHGHHPDYSKPLEVMWLCQKHHMELHRKD